MIGVVIVAHGGLAREYLATVEHVMGPQLAMCAISMNDNEDRHAKEVEIYAAAHDVDQGDGVIIVTDVFGGSPHNLCKLAAAQKNRKILFGANVPMLIKLTQMRHLSLDEAVAYGLRAGRKYLDVAQQK